MKKDLKWWKLNGWRWLSQFIISLNSNEQYEYLGKKGTLKIINETSRY